MQCYPTSETTKLPEIASETCWIILVCKLKKLTVKKGFYQNCLFFHLITYILSSRTLVAPPRYILLCCKSRFTHSPEAKAVKRCLKFTVSVPCSPSRIISMWCHCLSCKVKSVDITVTPCPRLNLFQKAQKASFTNEITFTCSWQRLLNLQIDAVKLTFKPLNFVRPGSNAVLQMSRMECK